MGIEVLVPDINLSASDFTAVRATGSRPVQPGGHRQFRGTGDPLRAGRRSATWARAWLSASSASGTPTGPFADFYDFCRRVDPVVLNKRTMESLVKAGAFDSLGHPRQGLCLVLEQVVDRTLARRREADQGVLSLFGESGAGEIFEDTRVPVPDNEFDKHTKLAFEKEMLGLYVSDHPLVGAEAALRRHADCTILDLREEGVAREAGAGNGNEAGAGGALGNTGGYGGYGGGGDRWVGGVVTGLARKYTKRGELMATFVLEDLQSSIEVFVFPRTMTEVGYLLADDTVVCVRAGWTSATTCPS